jgi:electron transfer flavoprotein beta subunit
MRILVAVKEVTTLADEFEIEGTRIPDQYVEHDLNEWDDYALETALRIQEESDDDVEVVAVSIGPERATETINMALAKGADRAVRVWDDSFEGVQLLDVGAKTDILERIVDSEDPELVLTGVQAGDDSFAATGVSLAKRLGFEWGAVVTSLDLDGETARLRRELEGGIEEAVVVELPAVFTVQTGINEPRYASLRGIQQARQKETVHYTLADLGLDDSTLTSALALTGMVKPEAEGDTMYLDGDPDEQAEQVADTLREIGVVEG